MIFYPSRPTVGQYGTTYHMSSHLTASGLSNVRTGRNGGVANTSNGGVKTRRAINARDLSAVFRLLSSVEGDFSGLERCKGLRAHGGPTQGGGGHMKRIERMELLDVVYAVARYECEESGVLLMDILYLNDTVTALFEELTDVLGRQNACDEFLAHPELHYNPVPSRDWLQKQALEYAVMFPLLYQLDAVEGGNFDLEKFLHREAAREGATPTPLPATGLFAAEVGNRCHHHTRLLCYAHAHAHYANAHSVPSSLVGIRFRPPGWSILPPPT
jgi:hypothetical protein